MIFNPETGLNGTVNITYTQHPGMHESQSRPQFVSFSDNDNNQK